MAEELTQFLTMESAGTPRNDFPGYIGMSITVGDKPIKVTSLGRIFIYGNTEKHALKLIDGRTGADLRGGTVVVSGGENMEFTWGDLPKPIMLEKGKTYYIVSEEKRDGDLWYHNDMEVSHTDVATINGAVYFWGRWNTEPNTVDHPYGPINFR